jgi:two-component sensor histidine kinase
VQNLVPELFKAYALEAGAPALELRVQDIRLGIDTAVPCGLIINELVTNCLKHAFPDGRAGTITIGFHGTGGGRITLEVSDDGIGLPEGLDIKKTQTMGLGMVQALTEQLEGTLEMDRGNGTAIRISFGTGPAEG